MSDLVTISKASEILGISTDTIRRWDKKGLIRTIRSTNNYRIFSIDELRRIQDKYLGKNNGVGLRFLEAEQRSKFTDIELFSGAGGLALGLENAGFNTQLLVEIDKNAAATLSKNRPNWNVMQNDISDVDFSEYKDKIDLIAGGFPCQSFSYAGHGRGFEDTRGTLFFEFARCVNEVRPKIALGENVRGLITHDNGRTLKTIISVLQDLGYNVQYRLLKSQFHDVPQKRERLVILGIRNDLNIPFVFPKENNYTISLREAFKNIPDSVGSKYPERKEFILSHVPEGGYWKDLPEDLQKEYMKKSYFMGGGKTGMARRLSWDEPSLTLTCSPAQKQTERCHPSETRPLNVREYARIQTFPDEWDFVGSIASQYKQIGNAVPVNMAYHIGRCLIAMLKNNFDKNTMEIVEDKLEPIQIPLPFSP